MLGLASFLIPRGASLNAVQLNGLLALGNGPIEVALSQLSTVLVGYGVKRNQFGEVIPVAPIPFPTIRLRRPCSHCNTRYNGC